MAKHRPEAAGDGYPYGVGPGSVIGWTARRRGHGIGGLSSARCHGLVVGQSDGRMVVVDVHEDGYAAGRPEDRVPLPSQGGRGRYADVGGTFTMSRDEYHEKGCSGSGDLIPAESLSSVKAAARAALRRDERKPWHAEAIEACLSDPDAGDGASL